MHLLDTLLPTLYTSDMFLFVGNVLYVYWSHACVTKTSRFWQTNLKEDGPIRTCFITADMGRECKMFWRRSGGLSHVVTLKQLGTEWLCLVGLHPQIYKYIQRASYI